MSDNDKKPDEFCLHILHLLLCNFHENFFRLWSSNVCAEEQTNGKIPLYAKKGVPLE